VFPLIVNKHDIYMLCKFTFLFLALNLQIFIKVKVPFGITQDLDVAREMNRRLKIYTKTRTFITLLEVSYVAKSRQVE
jgi:hypothetical protein